MAVIFPKNKVCFTERSLTIESKNIVLVGANGSGKTRLGSSISKKNPTSIFIAAQKSLILPGNIVLKSLEKAKEEFKNGSVQNQHRGMDYRPSLDPSQNLLFDFEQLLVLLFAEEAAISSGFRRTELQQRGGDIPKTKLDIVKEIWESVITHKKLTLDELSVKITDYSGSEMSDGERLIFYIIGQIVCADKDQIIIIDEPENHLHKAVVKKLYNQLEAQRSDCTLVYLTHDLDFAFTRVGSTKIWVKSYLAKETWEYEILDSTTPIPEQLYLEVLGSRQPVLFIEGEASSKDYKLYEKVFPEYTVKPLGSCHLVIQAVKSFNALNAFHHIKCFGLIDRDRRSDEEVVSLNGSHIWVLDVAEVENLLVAGDIVHTLATQMLADNPSAVVTTVRDNVINLFQKVIDDQVIIHFKEIYQQELNISGISSEKNFDAIVSDLDNRYHSIDKLKMMNTIKSDFQKLIQDVNYPGILRVFNLKRGIVASSQLCELIKLSAKPSPVEAIYERVLTILKQNDENGTVIKRTIQSLILGFQ